MRLFSRLILAFLLVFMGSIAVAQPQKGDVMDLAQGNSEFAARLYQRLADNQKDANLFFSPYSISNALAMTYAGAKGNTAVEMKGTLHFPVPDQRLHPAFGKLIAALQGDSGKTGFQLSVANRLWGQKDYGFLPDFLKIGRDYYGGGLEEVDFVGATEEARARINAWVDKETRGKIKDLIAKGVLNDLTRLVLTNAIYFKAAWSSPFEPGQTKDAAFHLADGTTVQAKMMHQHWRATFADLGDFSMVRLPYEGRGQSMLVLLPKKKDGLPALEKQLSADNLAKWSARLSDHRVDLKLPKFKVMAEFKLNDILKQMGMNDAFVYGKADFSGMATGEKLYITAVLHKAFVEVNEAGTEAAAATAVVVGTRSLPPAATFHADHPFLFLIRDDATGTILFMGRVASPS